jgi:hypothetical protein
MANYGSYKKIGPIFLCLLVMKSLNICSLIMDNNNIKKYSQIVYCTNINLYFETNEKIDVSKGTLT